MTLFEAFVQRNPFESNAFSRSRKLVFILDQVARLGALDAMGFAERIALSLAVAQRMSEALANTGSALDQQMGATVDSHSAFEDMRRVII